MADDKYQSTGALKLTTITPIIRAFFSGFGLADNLTAEGDAQIACTSKSSPPMWMDVLYELHELAQDLNLDVPPVEESFVGDYLPAFAKLYGAENDPVLIDLIASYQFTDYAELETVFLIAERLDDGHGLQGLMVEGAWEYGGHGAYHSRNVRYSSSSNIAIDVGSSLDKAISSGDLDSASGLLQGEMQGLLAAIQDESTRDQVSQKLAMALAQALPSDALANVLRQRGAAVAMWSKEDALKIIKRDPVPDMQESAHESFAGALLNHISSDLEDYATLRGSEFVDLHWIGLKESLVEQVDEEEEAPAEHHAY